MSTALASIFIITAFGAGLMVGFLFFFSKGFKDFLKWIQPALEGQDGKAAGKAITAFIMAGLVIAVVFFYIWFAVYALMRQAVISQNELSAAHYPMESLFAVAGLITALWGIGATANALMTKFTNPQPPQTNVTVQSDKTNINQGG